MYFDETHRAECIRSKPTDEVAKIAKSSLSDTTQPQGWWRRGFTGRHPLFVPSICLPNRKIDTEIVAMAEVVTFNPMMA
jgi:hypothetical protein